MALAYNHDEITARELKPALFELEGISREAVEAHYKLYQGYVAKRNEMRPFVGDRRRSPWRTPGPHAAQDVVPIPGLEAALRERAQHREVEIQIGGSGRRDQEPRALLRAPRRQRRRPRRPLRVPRRPRFRLRRRVAGGPEGDRHRGARLGVDGVRLGRGAALQLHRRRAEHVSRLERDAARRARRLRTRLLHRLRDRPSGVHRHVLRQPGLRRRQRLGPEVRHQKVAGACGRFVTVPGTGRGLSGHG